MILKWRSIFFVTYPKRVFLLLQKLCSSSHTQDCVCAQTFTWKSGYIYFLLDLSVMKLLYFRSILKVGIWQICVGKLSVAKLLPLHEKRRIYFEIFIFLCTGYIFSSYFQINTATGKSTLLYQWYKDKVFDSALDYCSVFQKDKSDFVAFSVFTTIS